MIVKTPVGIGEHEAWSAGDLLGLRVRGALTEADIDLLRAAVVAIRRAEGRCFLMADMTGMAGLGAAGRRRVAEWSKAPDEQMAGIVVFGCSFTTRAVLRLMLNAISLIGREQAETVFVADEAAAMRWLDERRAQR